MSWCDLNFSFYLPVVTLIFKSGLGYFSEAIRCRKLILGSGYSSYFRFIIGSQPMALILYIKACNNVELIFHRFSRRIPTGLSLNHCNMWDMRCSHMFSII